MSERNDDGSGSEVVVVVVVVAETDEPAAFLFAALVAGLGFWLSALRVARTGGARKSGSDGGNR